MTIRGWSVDLRIAQIELQWGGCRSIREILVLANTRFTERTLAAPVCQNNIFLVGLDLCHSLVKLTHIQSIVPLVHTVSLSLAYFVY